MLELCLSYLKLWLAGEEVEERKGGASSWKEGKRV